VKSYKYCHFSAQNTSVNNLKLKGDKTMKKLFLMMKKETSMEKQ